MEETKKGRKSWKGCLHGRIVGRGRGMSNWVRFGEINLA